MLQVTPEQAHNTLRNLVYNAWSRTDCESHVDIIKMLGAVDFFLPYFPLGRDSIHSLFEKQLQKQADRLQASHVVELTWDQQVVKFLVSKVSEPPHSDHCLTCTYTCMTTTVGTAQGQLPACLADVVLGGRGWERRILEETSSIAWSCGKVKAASLCKEQ